MRKESPLDTKIRIIAILVLWGEVMSIILFSGIRFSEWLNSPFRVSVCSLIVMGLSVAIGRIDSLLERDVK